MSTPPHELALAAPSPLPDGFSLESYIEHYRTINRDNRLLYIAEHFPELSKQALQLVLAELRSRVNGPQGTTNFALYKELQKRLGEPVDNQWLDVVERRSTQKLERLNRALSQYRNSCIKESTRIGYIELADFLLAMGDLDNAAKNYFRCKDYGSVPIHQVEMCLNMCKVHILSGNPLNAVNFASKAEKSAPSKEMAAQFRAVLGLVQFFNRKYKQAAQLFLSAVLDIGYSFADVFIPRDLILYGGLSALISYERRDLKTLVLDNPRIKESMELVPKLRDIITDFYHSRYSSCLRLLDEMRGMFELDIHLSPHLPEIFKTVRSNSIIQYFSPYTSVNMVTMAEALNTGVQQLEKELSDLIMNGKIQARIDSHNKIVHARHTDQRATTFRHAMKYGNDYQREAKLFLIRASLLQNKIVVRAKKGKRAYEREEDVMSDEEPAYQVNPMDFY